MSIMKYFLRLQYIDFLIRHKATGNQETFAQKNRLSKRGLAKVLEEMRQMGFPIKYDKNKRTYCYTTAGKMADKLFIAQNELLNRQDLKGTPPLEIDNICFSHTSVFEPCSEN